ncbi:MAG: protoheme IX farnesyltransferase [Myxococcales bacterium]|nr:protoheme IX farnesyltransferase [Myxococcales bacterium]
MVLVTALGGMFLAARATAVALDWRAVLEALGGIGAVVGGANALNMYLERHSDALMERTRDRPLPAGRLRPATALGFGLALALSALVALGLVTNAVTTALATLALGLYVLVYTPLKRHTDFALLIGAVPGAMPPLLGWTAVTGQVGAAGLGLFGVLFFWQLPHFIAIAVLRCDDYVRAGIRVLPAVRGARQARWYAVAYLAPLYGVSLALAPLGLAGPVYVGTATFLAAGSLYAALRGFGAPGPMRWARSLFVASLVYLPLLMAAVMVGW